MTPLAWFALGFIAGVVATLLTIWGSLTVLDILLGQDADEDEGNPAGAPRAVCERNGA